MSLLGNLRELFDESEDEIRSEIAEAEQRKKDAEERLKRLKERRKRRAERGRRSRQRRSDIMEWIRSRRRSLLIIAVLILGIIGASLYYHVYTHSFHYSCDKENPCLKCDAVTQCIALEDHEHYLYSDADRLWVTVKNKHDSAGSCMLNVTVEKNEGVETRTYPLGVLEGGQSRTFTFNFEIPLGHSQIHAEPICSYR